MGAHPHAILIWLMWRLEQTYEAHSGYCFRGSFLHRWGLTHSDSAAFHDAHHLLNSGNFGDEFTDHWFNTEDKWISLGRHDGYVEYCKKLKEQREAIEKSAEF